MNSAKFVVSCSHRGVLLNPQRFVSEEQAREHAGVMKKVADRVVVSGLPNQNIALPRSTGARAQTRRSGGTAKDAAANNKSPKQAENFVVLLVESDSETFDMLRKIADPGDETVVLSARSLWAAAAWVNAAPRIDLLISAANPGSGMAGVDVADLAAESHPGIDVVLLWYPRKPTIRGATSRYRFLRKRVDAEEITHLLDTAYLAFLQTPVVNR